MSKTKGTLGIIISSVIASLFIFGLNSVLATNATCFGIEGTTNGTPGLNEGVFEFAGGTQPPVANDACIQQQPDSSESKVYFEGWVWNDNLGWVSLKSVDEDGSSPPYENTSDGVGGYIDTGSIPYESYFNMVPDGSGSYVTGSTVGASLSPATSQLYGYWWGDNLGWLRLNCQEYVDNISNYCGTSNHKVYIGSIDNNGTPVDYTDDVAEMEGYAWSDSHGWVDFDGVRIPIGELYATYYPQVEVIPIKKQGSTWVEAEEEDVVRANGNWSYSLRVKFYSDIARTVLVDSDGVDFCFAWQDDRYLDFENPEASDPADIENCYSSPQVAFGSPDKYLNQDDFSYNDSFDSHILRTGSLPTSYVPAATGELALKKIIVNGIEEYPLDIADHSFVYEEPYDVRVYQADTVGDCREFEASSSAEFLDLGLGLNIPISFCSEYFRGQIADTDLDLESQYNMEVTDEFDDLVPVLFDYPQDNYLICSTEDESATHNGAAPGELFDLYGDAGLAGFELKEIALFLDFVNPFISPSDCEDEQQRSASVEAIDINSSILEASFKVFARYNINTGQEVVRMPAILENGNFAVEQANIEGNVQSGAVTLFQDDASFTSSGGTVRTEKREEILKTIKDSLKGRSLNCSFDTLNEYRLGLLLPGIDNCLVSDGLYVVEFTRAYTDAVDDIAPLVLSEIGWGAEDGEFIATNEPGKTIVVIGSSLTIDENLFFVDRLGDYVADKSFGIVSLENTAGRGGHVYITSNVTDIRAQIYADGSLFSVEDPTYTASVDYDTGAPSRVNEDRSTLRSQLAIIGQLIAQNTFGGGLSETPRLGDGSLTTDRELAKNFDLNFWRYSPTGLDVRRNGAGDLQLHTCEEFLGSQSDPGREQWPVWQTILFPDAVYDPENQIIDYELFSYVIENNIGSEHLSKYYCWNEEIGGETSKMLNFIKGGTQKLNERSIINIIFAEAPEGLPAFDN